MPERARATALPVTRNSTTLAKRQPNAQSALSPLQSHFAVPTRSGGSLQFTRRVNITTSRPLHDACSASDLLMRLNLAYVDRNVAEIIRWRRSWSVKCDD